MASKRIFASPYKGNFLLSQLASPAVGAYSVRKLSASYSGPLIRVGKTGDPGIDIGAVGGNLDVATLTAYAAGATTVQVITFYDQSGNGNDMAAINLGGQGCVIANNGVINIVNNTPAPFFNNNTYFRAANTQRGAGMFPLSIFTVCQSYNGGLPIADFICMSGTDNSNGVAPRFTFANGLVGGVFVLTYSLTHGNDFQYFNLTGVPMGVVNSFGFAYDNTSWNAYLHGAQSLGVNDFTTLTNQGNVCWGCDAPSAAQGISEFLTNYAFEFLLFFVKISNTDAQTIAASQVAYFNL